VTDRALVRLLGLAAGAILLAFGLAATMAPIALPSYDGARAQFRPSEAYLLDRHGEVIDLKRVDFGVRRFAWTPLADISPALVSAVLDGEDRRFWRHGGVDWRSAVGAVRDNIFRRRRRGASTITMQLATLLDPEIRTRNEPRGMREKLRQVRIAWNLESRWTKSQILEAYLNLVQFRGEVQGVRAAAGILARKAPSGLSLAEGYALAALLPNPAATPERVSARACARAVAAHAGVDCTELARATSAMLGPGTTVSDRDHLAPHLANAMLMTPGQRVATTLDARIQRLARDSLVRQLAGLGERNVRDGAAIVVDNATGDVVAYVGSAGLQSRSRQVDGVRARRQAGSTLKPFLYELAVERRYLTAASLLSDSPLNIDTASGLYIPQDYDHDFKGLVSVRTALGASLNVPAVRTLVLVGVEAFRDRLHNLGYAGITKDGEYYGYSLALGSAEVSLLEQAQAYRALATGGQWSPLRIRADDPVSTPRAVLAPDASFIVGDILSDRAARVVTFGLDSSLSTSFWSAVKTGTSKDMRDNWCIGYTAGFTVAVWVGNFEGDSMHDVSGVTGAAPVWRDIVDGLHPAGGSLAPARPSGVMPAWARYATAVEPPRREWFMRGTAPAGPIGIVGRRALIPRISSPANGMVIAIDPDIPPGEQRVPIAVQGETEGLFLRLNSEVVGQARDTILWMPKSGVHQLALEDSAGQAIDRILFTVR
jgi:penicillin-binding protein 1C